MNALPTHLRRFLACRAHFGAPLALLVRASRSVRPLEPVANVVRGGLARYTEYQRDRFDALHGTDTASRIAMSRLGLKDEHGDDFANWAYGPICPDFFREMMREIARRDELTFFDVGSGKGLALMLAGDYGFRRVAGIELSDSLNDVARKNFESYRARTGKRVNAEIICGDFMKHELPNEPTAFFLNNPFPAYIATHAVKHIEESIVKHPRRVVVAYRQAQVPILRQLQASPHLRLELTTPYWHIFTT